MKKKLLTIFILTIIVFAYAVSGCKGKLSADQSEKNNSVIDSRGVTVSVPQNINAIATFPAPHPHIIIYLDGNLQKVKGIHPLAKKAAEVSILSKIAPEISSVKDNFLSGSSLNIEEMLKVNPDVFFTDQLLQGMDNLEAMNIPVIYLGLEKEELNYRGKVREVYSPEKSIKEWVKITAQTLNADNSKADAIFAEWEKTRAEIEEKTAKIPDSQKKKILIVFKTAGNLFAGGNSFGQYWITVTGGINAAEEITGNHPAMVRIADFEEVLKWNPDIIYLTNFEETMPDDIYKNKIAGQDWSATKAYINRQVYKIPVGSYRWYPPSLDGPLMLKWMAKTNYPDIFNYNMEQEIETYYKTFFNYIVKKDDIDKILNPLGSGNF